MASLDLPGNVLSGRDPTWPISANLTRGPWAGANLLVVGSAGSGKLSLIRAISQALDSRIRLRLLDFETEPQSQSAILNQLSATRRENPATFGRQPVEAIVFRHIHRLTPKAMMKLVAICRGLAQPSDQPPMVFHATSHRFADYPETLKDDLSSFFNCVLHWSGFPRNEAQIRQFVNDVLADLNRRHGRQILGIDPPVVDLVQHIAERANLYELRNVIERAYFREESSSLSARAVAAACPSGNANDRQCALGGGRDTDGSAVPRQAGRGTRRRTAHEVIPSARSSRFPDVVPSRGRAARDRLVRCR